MVVVQMLPAEGYMVFSQLSGVTKCACICSPTPFENVVQLLTAPVQPLTDLTGGLHKAPRVACVVHPGSRLTNIYLSANT